MQIASILQSSDIYYTPKTNDLNSIKNSSEFNDSVSKVNMNNIEIARSNPSLESNQRKKEEELTQLLRAEMQKSSQLIKAVLYQSMEAMKNKSSYN